MARKKKEDKLRELEERNADLEVRLRAATKRVVKIITFNPASLPYQSPTTTAKKPRLVKVVDKQKQLAVRALLDLEPDHHKAQEFVEKYGSADGS